MAIVDTLRLVGTPGTNKVMAGELSRLAKRALSMHAPKPRKQGTGALVYPFDARLAQLAVHYHRTATRVLRDLYETKAKRLEPLYEELLADARADGRELYRDGSRISVRVRNVAEFAAGERQIVGTVKNALIEAAATKGISLVLDPDDADILFTARMHDGILSVSIDLAGRSLSQRGYRQKSGVAPIREHLAAVLVMLARHDARSEILLDPMCGSGTIAIEGALMARAAPLWVPPRRPALDSLPGFDKLESLTGAWFGDTRPLVVANEIDYGVVAAARRNATDAGVGNIVQFRHGDFRDLDAAEVCSLAGVGDGAPGVIIVNPPYGERLDQDDLAVLYRDLGSWARQFRGWRIALLVANPEFKNCFGGNAPRIAKPLANGPVRGYFYLYEL